MHLATRISAFLCLTLLAARTDAAENRPQPATARTKADLHSFVNWDFRHRRKLKGWRATETAIQRTLEQWFPGRPTHTLVENGNAGALRAFLGALPARADCDLSVVYLASHQSPAGEWDFVQKNLESVSAIAAGANVPRHPARIVIVDACYAAALQREPAWARALQSPTVFAALADEETYELDFSTPQPLDLRRRYPAAAAWLDQHMGKSWDGKLSFLGLVWVQTFVTSHSAPADQAGWAAFLRRCGQTAEEFRRNADSRLASQITFSSPAGTRVPVRDARK